MKYRIVYQNKDQKMVKGPFVHELGYIKKLVRRMSKMCPKGHYDYIAVESYDELELMSKGSIEQKITNIRELKTRGIYERETLTDDNRHHTSTA